MYVVKMDTLKSLGVSGDDDLRLVTTEHPNDTILTKSLTLKLKPNMLVRVENRGGDIFATPLRSSLTHYSENQIRDTWSKSWVADWSDKFHGIQFAHIPHWD